MNAFHAVTLDFYGTLVTHGTCEEIYAQFASDRVAVEGFRRRFDEEMVRFFDWLTDRPLHDLPEFPTIRHIYRDAFRRLFAEFRIDADVEEATAVLMDHVARPQLFPETIEALNALRERFDLCLVTDADDDMIATALAHTGIALDHVVTSESLRSYKASRGSPLFRRALELLGARPDETVHIGDRLTDVLGARWNGLHVVCIQRDGNRLLDSDVQPDAIVEDLHDAVRWLSSG